MEMITYEIEYKTYDKQFMALTRTFDAGYVTMKPHIIDSESGHGFSAMCPTWTRVLLSLVKM